MLDFLILSALVLLGLPVAMFLLECGLGLFRQSRSEAEGHALKTIVLIPAHNEALLIENTLNNIREQLENRDQILVVADNCSDDTASLARAAGCKVLERHSDTERGKGYALAFGVEHMQADPPEVVVIVDADCHLAPGALAQLKHAVIKSGHPAQACYLMKRGEVNRIAIKVAEFAFMIKNRIRLLGLSRLGMPVPLTGTGMAFPWHCLADARLATGDIVEDMRLGVELAEAGKGARYCDGALVYSYFPSSEAAEKTQRERWEHGHLNTLIRFVPRLMKRALAGPSVSALGMMLDLMVPPLSLLVMLLASFTLLILLLAMGGLVSWPYLAISAIYLLAIAMMILLVWWRHGRESLSASEILHLPFYALSKIAIYVAYLVRKQTKWIRTERK